MPLHVSSTSAHRQEVKIVLYGLWYHQTYRCVKLVNINLNINIKFAGRISNLHFIYILRNNAVLCLYIRLLLLLDHYYI